MPMPQTSTVIVSVLPSDIAGSAARR